MLVVICINKVYNYKLFLKRSSAQRRMQLASKYPLNYYF